MKAFHKQLGLLLGIGFALITIITLSFASIRSNIVKKDSNHAKALKTWYFNGTNPLDSSHYSLTQTIPCEGEPQTVCAIEADEDGTFPDLSGRKPDIQEVLDDIANNQTPTTNNTVKSFRANP